MLRKIKAILHSKGYVLHSKPYELNIVGLRSRNTRANRFDDQLHVFYKTGNTHWEYHVFNATTDPGTFWLQNPMQAQGTAILAEGQYSNAYAIGLHKGLYEALVQVKPVTILRDYDRNAVLDFSNGKKVTGYFGINLHRANRTGTTKYVNKNSAGCQVFENADDFAAFMKLCNKHRELHGNHFTYTLLDFRAVQRQNIRWATYAAGLLGAGLLTTYYYQNKHG
jgi:hypothetical protein